MTRRLGRVKRSNMATPRSHAQGAEALGVLLVDGLAADPERRGDLGPRPALAHRPLDLPRLQPVREAPERDDRGEALGGVPRDRFLLPRYECHASTIVDKSGAVNPGCSRRGALEVLRLVLWRWRCERVRTTSSREGGARRRRRPFKRAAGRCPVEFVLSVNTKRPGLRSAAAAPGALSNSCSMPTRNRQAPWWDAAAS